MLFRAAVRTVAGRTVARPPAAAATIRWTRSYASKPRPPKKPSPFEKDPNVGTRATPAAKDHTWKPNDPIILGAGSAAAAGGSKPASSGNDGPLEEAAEFNTQATPESNTAPDTQPGPGQVNPSAINLGPPPDNAQAESAEIQDTFGGPQSASANTAPSSSPTQPSDPAEQQQEQPAQPLPRESDSAAQQSEIAEPQAPSQPLPDLRQGIPSTFDAEFGRPAGSARPETEAPGNLNITEDPAQPSTGSGGGRDRDELPRSAYETSVDRRRNRMANIFYALFAIGGLGGAVYLGRDWDDEREARAHPDVPSGWGFKKFYDRAKARINGSMGYYTEPTFPKLLPNMDPAPPYTLVLSLEDLMIHSDWSREHGWRTAKRPGLDYFLRYLSQYYELVIFTTLPSASADPIIRKLDPFHIIMWPLFREATRYEKGEYIKDLSFLNRDLSKVILIDTKASHAKNQPENAIILPPWKGNPQDKDLVALIPFLEYVAAMGLPDTRQVLKSFEGTHIPTEFAAREAKARQAFYKSLEEERAKKPKHSGVGFLASALGMKPQAASAQGGEQSIAQGIEQGKFLSDQIRERGMRQYEVLEKEIRENGEKWLKEMAAEEKKAQEEQMRSMRSGFTSYFGGKKE